MVWNFIIQFVITLVVSYALRPKPEAPTPSSLGDLQVPVAEEGLPIPVLFGTRDIRGPNVVWYGDFSTVAVKSKGGKK